MLYAISFFTAMAAGAIQTITGFGAAIILMTVLPYFFDILQASALASSITLGVTIALSWRFRRHIDLHTVLFPTIVFQLTSLFVIQIAGGLDMDLLGIAFGAFLILVSLYFLAFDDRIAIRGTPAAAFCVSFLSGACSGLFGIGGPLMAVYFLAVTRDKESYTADLQFLFALTNTVNLGLRIHKGFYLLSFLPMTITGILGINLGKAMSLRILHRIDKEMMHKLVYLLVGISGAMALFPYLARLSL